MMLTTANGMAQEHCMQAPGELMMKNNLILEDKGKAEDFEKGERTNKKKRWGERRKRQRKLVHTHLKFMLLMVNKVNRVCFHQKPLYYLQSECNKKALEKSRKPERTKWVVLDLNTRPCKKSENGTHRLDILVTSQDHHVHSSQM